MNPVEIEEAVSKLVDQPFDRQEFAYSFFEAFGYDKTTITRIRKTKYYHSKFNFGGGRTLYRTRVKEYYFHKTYILRPVT